MCAWCGGGGLTCLSTYAHVNGENRTQDPSLSHCFIYSQKKKTGHKIPLSHTRTHGFIYSQLNDFKNGLRRTVILFSRLSHQGRAACIFFFFSGETFGTVFATYATFLQLLQVFPQQFAINFSSPCLLMCGCHEITALMIRCDGLRMSKRERGRGEAGIGGEG